MNTLPREIVDLILEYQGYHSWRNGKYICHLQLDERYDAVKRMPTITLDKNNTFKTCFTKIKQGTLYKYNIHTSIYSGKIHWYMDIYAYYSQHQYKKNKNYMSSYLTKTVHYIFEHNEKQHSPVIHL